MKLPWQKPTSIKELLTKDKVKAVLDEFVSEHLPEAQGIILIWATRGEVFCDTGGFPNDAEVIGTLEYIKHEIEHKGVPKR